MSMWAIRLTHRESRAALAAAFRAVAGVQPDLQLAPTAARLADLTSWAYGSLDDVDYERRLAAYGGLTAKEWAGMTRLQVRGLADM